MPSPRQKFTDNSGKPLVNGMVFTYAAGTSTPLAAFQDPAGAVAHPNPIRLDSRGEATVYFLGSYKIDVKTAAGNQVPGYPVDNFTSTNSAISQAVDAADALLRGQLADQTSGAGLVGFKQPGISGTLRTVKAKLLDLTVSPYDFGAVGNGIADDTPAVTAAINTGKSLDIRNGTFLINLPLLPKSGTEWAGDFTGTIKYASKAALIDIQSVSNFKMRGVVVDGNYTAYMVTDGNDAPWGVRMEQCTNVEISGNHFKRLYRIGVSVGHVSANPNKAIRILNNLIENIGIGTDPMTGFGNGIAVICADGVTIRDNTVRNISGNVSATAGINLEPALAGQACCNIEVVGNRVSNVLNSQGIQSYMAFVPTASLDNINIHDNIVSDTGTGWGISADNFGVTDIHHNILTRTEGIHAIRFPQTDVCIDDNTINGTLAGPGVIVRAVRTLSVCRNRLRNIKLRGLDIGVDTLSDNDVKIATIIGNEIHTCGLEGIGCHAYNFAITGNTVVNCGTESTTAYYLTNYPGTLASLNGFIGGNTFIHYGSNTVAGFIDCEGGTYDNVTFGENNFVGTPLPYYTYQIAGRCPGIYTDLLPAAGAWKVGDKIYRRTPVAGGNLGWVITTAPLTWKEFGVIQA